MRSRLVEHITPEAFNEAYIKTEYSPYAQNQVAMILKRGINDQAVSRQNVEAITIDGATSLDLDDAIWVERTKKWYCVWVHISDVSEAIDMYSPLDIEALHRTTSIYRKEYILDMLPPELSNNTLSLNPYGNHKKQQLTLSLKIELNEEAQVEDYHFFESTFKNTNRYDYESFWHDYQSPEAENYTTLHLMKEVSDKLRINRVNAGWHLDYTDDDRWMVLGMRNIRSSNNDYHASISHNIIESFMVLANSVAGEYLSRQQNITSLYKLHNNISERSFYDNIPHSLHAWLGIRNYTHFTSPIRRYVDVIIHRIIKCLIRNDIPSYSWEDINFIAKHVNITRWKIETLGAQMDMNEKGEHFVEKAIKRFGRPLEVCDMKEYIRNTTDKSLFLPKVMKDTIIERISKAPIGNWVWSVGVILLGKDKDIKEVLKQRILEKWCIGPKKLMNVLQDTRILRWGKKIFEIQENGDEKNLSIKILCHGVVVAKSKWILKNYETSWRMRYDCRKKAIENMCDYFINL